MSKKTQQWIQQLIAGLDEHVDKETCAKILEECGRQCTPASLVKKAKTLYEASSDVGEFLEKLGEVFEELQIEDDGVYVVYPRCYCPQIEGIAPGKLSATYCNCSRGWIKQLFEGAIGQEVSVKLVKSIVDGATQCRFKVEL